MNRNVTTYTLLFPLLFAISVRAQETPDTTSAWRYFPLEVGNVWEYEGEDYYEGTLEHQRWAVTADTLIGAVRYFRLAWQQVDTEGAPAGPLHTAHVRFDSLSTALVRWSEGGSAPYAVPWGFPLGAPFGSHPPYDVCKTTVDGGYGMPVEIGDDSVVTSVKTVDLGNCEVASTFAAGIGLVRYTALGGYLSLRYARVRGVEYGEPFSVSTETAPDSREAPALQFYPNPLHSTGTAVLAMGQSGQVRLEVVDLLGREVAVLVNGLQPAGHHEVSFNAVRLAPGAYILRLATAGQMKTQMLTVTR